MKTYVAKAQAWFERQSWEIRMLFAAAVLAGIPAVLMSLSGSSAPPPENRSGAPSGVDTFIPKGFVLVPIEVTNYEALDSILGKFGVVDLYQPAAPAGDRAKLVARNVRLLRAPQNPSLFAILIRESDSERILRFGATFQVILKRPEKVGTEFVKSSPVRHRRIVYDGGS